MLHRDPPAPPEPHRVTGQRLRRDVQLSAWT